MVHNIKSNSTTFERAYVNSRIFVDTRGDEILSKRHRINSLDNSRQLIPTIYTNFRLLKLNTNIRGYKGFPTKDFDFHIPLKPKKSFVVKAHIKSITKFQPKPFFD